MRLLTNFVSFILGLSLLLQASAVFAQDPLIARFSTSNVKPWGFLNQEGMPAGLLISLVHELENELTNTRNNRVTINNNIRPYPRVIHEIKKGAIDFAVMFNSPEANKIGIPLGKVADHKILIVGLAGTPPINNLNQLQGKPVGHIRGSKYGPLFDNHQSLNKLPLGSMEQGLNMLLKKRIYAFASADQTLYYALRELQIPSHKVIPLMTVSEVSTALYFSKASTRTYLIQPLTDALAKLKAKGVLDSIFYKDGYLPSSSN